MVELHLGALDDASQLARAAVGDSLLQVGIAALHVGAQNVCDPLRILEILNRLLDVVGQEASAAAQTLGRGDLSVNAGLEDAIERQVRIGVRGNGADLSPH